jgi:hypothetical protein
MRYSYAWDVTGRDFWSEGPAALSDSSPGIRVIGSETSGTVDFFFDPALLGRYVRTTGPASHWGRGTPISSYGRHVLVALDDDRLFFYLQLTDQLEETEMREGMETAVRGRAILLLEGPAVDATASRFTGASVAGLVVGAMGLFVFTVALRHWLGERRVLREEARA